MNYGKKKNAKKQKAIASRKPAQKKKLGIRLFKGFLLCFVLLLATACVGGFIFLKKIIDDAPEITAESVKPSGYITTIYADDGATKTEELLSAGSNRIEKTLDEIPVNLQHAFVAIEDTRFYQHNGIDYRGIARAFVNGVKKGNFDEGASTITQQLLKNNLFDFMSEETFYDKLERKIQEQYLAVELENIMSKDDILVNYMNTINLGQNTLGVQAASLRYFGKDVSELSLSECAVIAGITQNPGKYNPITSPDDNRERREKVLTDMLDQEYITQAEYDEAIADTGVYDRIQAVNDAQTNDSPYSYFNDALVEQVQKDLVKAGLTETQAYNKLFTGGLTIYSTQNEELQKICDEEMNDDSNFSSTIKYGISYYLTVTRADGTVNNYGSSDIKTYAKNVNNDQYGLLYYSEEKAREVIEAWKATIAQEGDQYEETLTLTKQPQSSVTLIENETGHIKALVGGRGDKTSSLSFNRAYTGAKRQPGSTFKILAAYAPAIDKDLMTLSTIIKDEPYKYADGTTVNNWYSGYRGNVTVRKAIEQSMNICAVKAITEVTPEVAVEYLNELGITTLDEEKDRYQSLALGGLTYGVYNYEITAAYAAIANHGLYNEPVLYTKILDHDGNVLLENNNQNSKQVLKASTADLLTEAMQDVVTQGTGTQARLGSMPVAGKTGTTSDDKDLWFCGYTPYYTCSVWLGYDDPKPMTGEWQSHMVIWKGIMQRVHDGLEVKEFEMRDVEMVSICTITGLLASSSCPSTSGYYPSSQVPDSYCPGHYSSGSGSGSSGSSDTSDNDSNDTDNQTNDNPDDTGNTDGNNGGTDNNGDTGTDGGTDNTGGTDNSGDTDNTGGTDNNGDSDNNGGGETPQTESTTP